MIFVNYFIYNYQNYNQHVKNKVTFRYTYSQITKPFLYIHKILHLMDTKKFVTIGAVIALVIFILGFIGPWYNVSGEFFGIQASVDIGLTGTTISGGIDSTSTISIVDRGETDNTMYLTILVIITTIITIIGLFGVSINLGKTKTMYLIGETFGFITLILAIITVTYYVINLPDTSDIVLSEMKAGLGWGFYLYFIGAIVIFLTVIWSRISKPEET